MATYLKIKKEGGLTPDYIKGKLFSFADAAHSLHLETKSYSEHKALGNLYDGLIGFRDSICESLMGYMDGKRIGAAKLDAIPEYSKDAAKELAEEIKDFGYELYEWAGDKKYCDVENMAQDLSGLGAKTIYLLTLT